jgi:hypothetical protein
MSPTYQLRLAVVCIGAALFTLALVGVALLVWGCPCAL